MKTIRILPILFLLMLAQFNASAQFTSAEIGVDGLTCSACTRSVEMSIRKLGFVDSVAMNLEHTEGTVIFKKNAKVDIEKIAKAVTDAGFSLRSLTASVNVNELKAGNDFCWVYENNTYHFVKMPAAADLKGTIKLRFIGADYMSKKELRGWKNYMTSSCNEATPHDAPSSKSYYVSPL